MYFSATYTVGFFTFCFWNMPFLVCIRRYICVLWRKSQDETFLHEETWEICCCFSKLSFSYSKFSWPCHKAVSDILLRHSLEDKDTMSEGIYYILLGGDPQTGKSTQSVEPLSLCPPDIDYCHPCFILKLTAYWYLSQAHGVTVLSKCHLGCQEQL